MRLGAATVLGVNEAIARQPGEREASLCPCKSGKSYGVCCRPFHVGQAKPQTAEQLMRSRYSAYFFRRLDYLVETTHPDTRSKNLKRELEASMAELKWSFLTILQTSKGGLADKTGKVEFVAQYFLKGKPFELREHSRFKRHKGAWKYLDDKG